MVSPAATGMDVVSCYIQHLVVDSISQDHIIQESAGRHSVNVENFAIRIHIIGVCNQPTKCDHEIKMHSFSFNVAALYVSTTKLTGAIDALVL